MQNYQKQISAIAMFEISAENNPTVRQYRQIARIHEASFAEPWSPEVLRSLGEMTGVKIYLAIDSDDGKNCLGFLIVRATADEAEILTIAVGVEHRRSGVARCLIKRAIRDLRDQSCLHVFLEVSVANLAAKRLYENFEFKVVGTRTAYSRNSDGGYDDASVMRYQFN